MSGALEAIGHCTMGPLWGHEQKPRTTLVIGAQEEVLLTWPLLIMSEKPQKKACAARGREHPWQSATLCWMPWELEKYKLLFDPQVGERSNQRVRGDSFCKVTIQIGVLEKLAIQVFRRREKGLNPKYLGYANAEAPRMSYHAE